MNNIQMTLPQYLDSLSEGPVNITYKHRILGGYFIISIAGGFCYKGYGSKHDDNLDSSFLELNKKELLAERAIGEEIAPNCYHGLFSIIKKGDSSYQVVRYGEERGSRVVNYLLKMVNARPVSLEVTSPRQFKSLGERIRKFHSSLEMKKTNSVLETISLKCHVMGMVETFMKEPLIDPYDLSLVRGVWGFWDKEQDDLIDVLTRHGDFSLHNLVFDKMSGGLGFINTQSEVSYVTRPYVGLAKLIAGMIFNNRADLVSSLLEGYGGYNVSILNGWVGYYLLARGLSKLKLAYSDTYLDDCPALRRDGRRLIEKAQMFFADGFLN